MSAAAIRAEGLGKRYRIGGLQAPYRTLRESLTHGAGALLRGLGGRRRPKREHIWALDGVSFEVEPGEVVGIIGRNGAGKTTLLKVLSQITEPTRGRAELRGRVGSLLEVGTGFHPELSGRENVYLNGAILGMGRREIDAKFEEIAAFSEVEKFLDTPVKHYSSGMYLRLAFAVAAHLETEILLVDEVLAVGDASFQTRCMGKIGSVARTGRTVLFVSHNLGAVAKLCERGLLLDQGRLVHQGPIEEVIRRYTEERLGGGAVVAYPDDPEKVICIREARLLDHRGEPATELDREQPFRVAVEYAVRRQVEAAHLGVMLDRADGTPVCHAADIDVAPGGAIDRRPGLYRSTVEFPGGLLNAGAYQIRIGFGRYGGQRYDYREPFLFSLIDRGTFASLGAGGRQRPGVLSLALGWATEPLDGGPPGGAEG